MKAYLRSTDIWTEVSRLYQTAEECSQSPSGLGFLYLGFGGNGSRKRLKTVVDGSRILAGKRAGGCILAGKLGGKLCLGGKTRRWDDGGMWRQVARDDS